MRYREICKMLGAFFFAFSTLTLIPLMVSIYYQHIGSAEDHPQAHGTEAFLWTFLIGIFVALLFSWLGRGQKAELYRREGLVAVVLIWILAPALAALPFLISGTIARPAQAYFEATSGLTTTGASLLFPKRYNAEGEEIPYRRLIRGEFDTIYVFYGTVTPIRDAEGKVIHQGIEAVGKGLLFWRSFLQWVGGLGIIVLFVAILPALGVGGRMLFHAEMPGPMKETFTPRLKETAIFLWKVYVGLSLLEVALLLFTNGEMTLFDATCITFSNISTGGFTVRNGSIDAYQSVNTELVVILFMLVGSINFSLYFYFLKGKFFRFRDPELMIYLSVIFIAGCFATYNLWGSLNIPLVGDDFLPLSFKEALRTGFFQTISAQTSTGFSTVDFDKWPYMLQVGMLILIYLGGMSGSTAGGMKMIRHIMLFRVAQNKVELIFRPETVRRFRIGKHEVDSAAAITVLCFFLIVASLAVCGTFLLTVTGMDPETALAVITSTINNSGMGFREAGPTDSYAFLNDFSCLLTSAWMIMGRLEFFAVLVILVPAFWKTRS